MESEGWEIKGLRHGTFTVAPKIKRTNFIHPSECREAGGSVLIE